eukprot:1893251-Alexandrium_andersonii.AAC.1
MALLGSIGSIRYSVRSLLGVRVTEYLLGGVQAARAPIARHGALGCSRAQRNSTCVQLEVGSPAPELVTGPPI